MYDFIIVGQGLAGSAVAIQLLKRKYRILVIDQRSANNSSRIAAGLFNPVTGKKMVKTWLADVLFPYLFDFYRDVEQRTGTPFFHPEPLYRPFLSVGEQNEWMAKSVDPTYEKYIQEVTTQPSWPQIKDPFGGLILKQCGFINTTAYIHAARILIEAGGTLLNELFRPQLVSFKNDFVSYGNYQARKIIVCSGVHSSIWFNWLPVRPLKGETLKIKTGYQESVIINRGIYLVPVTKGEWRVGSTYQFNDKSESITTEARQELEIKMQDLIAFPYEVLSQEWGMRPTTPDRRPLLGVHPEFDKLIVFNGLGTKGVSLAPYFSEMLVHWLENKVTLIKEVDIKRYKLLYSGSPT
ncbi:MAG TPA: FAD-dependent oxidoreductase [Ohtaekwangia sp.]|nr:FAD-dependent oxidoreductase [Ohtaekwangia sp.]